MAETILKRLRSEETSVEDDQVDMKRSKSSNYNQILSFLEEDEEETDFEDVTSFIANLQQELFSEPATSFSSSSSFMSPNSDQDNDDQHEDGKERVMRHLLEASDDELGIPNYKEDRFDHEEENHHQGNIMNNGVLGCEFSLEMWEIEDETANFYTLLQSDLFM